MNHNKYIVASSKEWGKSGFQDITSEIQGEWIFVSSVGELDSVLHELQPRYIFFLHWNWYVPERIWSKLECICFHMTDVPYGRGGSPLQNLILAGHQNTMLSALRMVGEMDAGPVYLKRPLSLTGRAEEIYRNASDLSFDMIRWIINNQPEPVPQNGEATKFKRRIPDQSILPDKGSMKALYDHIRMLDAPSYPLAYLKHGKFVIEFSHADLIDNELSAKVRIRQGDEVNEDDV